jgi:hypothetical protein
MRVPAEFKEFGPPHGGKDDATDPQLAEAMS